MLQIPETPKVISDLDIMKRLDDYANSRESWLPSSCSIKMSTREACKELYSTIIKFEKVVSPLLRRTNAKEMDKFTMHDELHALKVAHLMWHIIKPNRRKLLTPPEIGLMVISAYLHDLGMFLSNQEREERLNYESDLWDRLDYEQLGEHFKKLKEQISKEKEESKQLLLYRKLTQIEEIILCQDTRERHTQPSRYLQLLSQIQDFHSKNSTVSIDIEARLSFEGDSFVQQLINICSSHGEFAECLVSKNVTNPERKRFPNEYPFGNCNADIHFVAAALRLADVLDFDRERTPPVIFYYFLPGALDLEQDYSALEWRKHLAISNWCIKPEEIVFQGRCDHYLVHHAIISFCSLIEKEITHTRDTFEIKSWPFLLPICVKADIYEEGYRYLPLKFELDDERIYQFLMGNSLYTDPLSAVRELVQNAVDACKLRDQLTLLYEPEVIPSTTNRIFIEFVEATQEYPYPILTVRDTGTGMDDMVLRNWFLKVGQSYYNSTEFNSLRVQLRKANLDFAPVSEFGIGFLAAFMLSDKVKVETAMWQPVHGDTCRRVLEIHGPTKLIHYAEFDNASLDRLRGTNVSLTLTRGNYNSPQKPPTWEVIKKYLYNVCRDLPYRLNLIYKYESQVVEEFIDPFPQVEVPTHLKDASIQIKVDDKESGLKGEIVLFNPLLVSNKESNLAKSLAAVITDEEQDNPRENSALLRGGFRISSVPGLPESFLVHVQGRAILSMSWERSNKKRYALTNVARNDVIGHNFIANDVIRIWLSWLLEHVEQIPYGFLSTVDIKRTMISEKSLWMERYDAYTVYQLACTGWHGRKKDMKEVEQWEESSGKGLSINEYAYGLCVKLLHMVLPKVCKLEMGPEASFSIRPPVNDWQDILKSCHDYIRNPVRWEYFVDYTGRINDLLYYEYPRSDYLNAMYQDRMMSVFAREDINYLLSGLEKLAENKQERQALLSRQEYAVLERAQSEFGELKIGSIDGTWRLDSFKISK